MVLVIYAIVNMNENCWTNEDELGSWLVREENEMFFSILYSTTWMWEDWITASSDMVLCWCLTKEFLPSFNALEWHKQ